MHFLMYLLAVALQAPDSGAFVITLGKDTIGMERYTRTADRLVDDMVMRDRAPVISRHFVATLGADGLISHIELDNKPVVASAVSPIHAVGRYTKDEAFVDLTRNGQTTTAHVATPDGRGVLPFINFCYALYDQTGLRARALGGSPVKVAVLGFGGTNTFDLTVTFPARDSMGVAFEGDAPTLFKVDAAGRILGADGRLTTQKVVVTRVPTLDLDAFAAAFGDRPLGQLSPPDSVRVDVAGAHIAVDYGRPAMRGRKIFGDIVPWNKVWRTGGNFATRFTTSADLVMGGTTIPKGAYTLWTLPASTGWKLILNKQTKAPCEGEACTLPTRAPPRGTDYAADSDVVRFELITHNVSGGPGPLERRATASFSGDTAVMTVPRGESTATMRVKTGPGALPYVGQAYALVEEVTRRARVAGTDRYTATMLPLGTDEPWNVEVNRLGTDSLTIQIGPIGPLRMRVDERGTLLGISGSGSTMQVTVERVQGAGLDFDALGKSFAPRSLGTLSPPDSVRASVAGATVAVRYSRPSMRGRVVFGNVVPWNQVWRTGANEATVLETSADLTVAGTAVPAGKYSLWTIPSPTGWKLIVNKNTGQWGTDYDARYDLARLDMRVETLRQPMEQFTIAIEPKGTGGVLKLEWEKTRASIPFSAK